MFVIGGRTVCTRQHVAASTLTRPRPFQLHRGVIAYSIAYIFPHVTSFLDHENGSEVQPLLAVG
jgi:hypothetical protein